MTQSVVQEHFSNKWCVNVPFIDHNHEMAKINLAILPVVMYSPKQIFPVPCTYHTTSVSNIVYL